MFHDLNCGQLLLKDKTVFFFPVCLQPDNEFSTTNTMKLWWKSRFFRFVWALQRWVALSGKELPVTPSLSYTTVSCSDTNKWLQSGWVGGQRSRLRGPEHSSQTESIVSNINSQCCCKRVLWSHFTVEPYFITSSHMNLIQVETF